MQTVTQQFREQEYSGEALFNCILRINDNLVPVEQIAKITIKSPIIDTSTETFYVGTFISQSVIIKFKNLDGLNIQSKDLVHLEIGQSVEGVYTYLPMGEYIVDDLAENYYTTCEITCLDYAIKFKPNIDYSPCFTDGKADVNTIIQYICDSFGIELGSDLSLLPNSNVEVGTYDSTISGKQWLSYLAEIKGCNLKMSRDGKLLFIPFVREADVEINALESAEWEVGEKYQLSQIIYFDAVRNFTYGDDSGNTLFIRQDNPFITDESVISNLADNMLYTTKTTEKSKEIDIEDGNSNNKASLQIFGDTTQNTTTGKNLLNFSSLTTQTINELTITNNGDGSITLNGTTSSSVSLKISDNMSNLTTGTYSFSRNSSGTVSASFTNILYGYNTSVYNIANITSETRLSITPSVDYATYYLWLYIPSGITFTNYIMKPQLEEGNEVTEYEPYTYGASPNPNYPQEVQVVTGLQTITITDENDNNKEFEIDLGTLELCKVADFQDYIHKENGKWYKHKEISKTILNGSENWTYYNSSRWKFRLVFNDIKPFTNNNLTSPTTILSDYFSVSYWDNPNNNYKFTGMRDINTTISFANTDITSLANWKTWLSNNNATVYYVLDTPIEEEITNTTLINQLEAINNFHLFNNVNNIVSLSSNLIPYLKLSYDVNKLFTIWSLKNKNYGDISLDAWDIIQFNLGDEQYLTYNDNTLTYELNIMTNINTQIPTKQKEVTTNVVYGDEATNIKMLKTTLDYVKNQISLLVSETSGLTEQTNQLVMDILSTQNIFQITGGVNLINNSQFLFEDLNSEYWSFTNNGSNPYNNIGNGYDANLIGKTTAVAKIKLRDTIAQTTTENIVNLLENQQYTLNYSYTQDNLTSTTVQLIENISGNVIFEKTYNNQVSNITNETFTFIAEETAYTFKITTSTVSGDTSVGYFNMYDLMLNSGDKRTWTPAKSEVYSTVVKMSQMGLSVFATGSNIVTLLTSQGFQVRKYANGQIGLIITEFTDTGIITGDIESDSISTGKYISTEMMINGVEHHVEYFKE